MGQACNAAAHVQTVISYTQCLSCGCQSSVQITKAFTPIHACSGMSGLSWEYLCSIRINIDCTVMKAPAQSAKLCTAAIPSCHFDSKPDGDQGIMHCAPWYGITTSWPRPASFSVAMKQQCCQRLAKRCSMKASKSCCWASCRVQHVRKFALLFSASNVAAVRDSQ